MQDGLDLATLAAVLNLVTSNAGTSFCVVYKATSKWSLLGGRIALEVAKSRISVEAMI